MNPQEKISVIVPIYNVEQYLSRCLDCVSNQTYKNIEIILVDDGSPDNSGKICDLYAHRNDRIRVYHRPNCGVGKARQFGVENSTGEYIIFVDPDDCLPLNSLELLYANMLDSVDVVIGSASINNCKKQPLFIDEFKIMNNDEWLRQLLNRDKAIFGSPWSKLYRRRLFTVESFPNLRRSQDWLMNIELSMRVHNIALIPDVVYYYYIYNNSASHKNYPNIDYWTKYTSIIYDMLVKNNRYQAFESFYYRSNLMIIFDCIANGISVPKSKKWVSDTYLFTAKANRSIKQFVVINMLRCNLIQRLLYAWTNIKRSAYRVVYH